MNKIKPLFTIKKSKNYNINRFIYLNKLNILCTSQKIQLINLHKLYNFKNDLQKKSLFFYFFLYVNNYAYKKNILQNNYNVMSLKKKSVYFVSDSLSQSLINIIFLYYKGRLLL